MIWSRRRSTRSAVPPRPGASATARSSSPTSRKRSGSEPENPGWTLSKPGAIRILRLETGKGLLRQPDFVRDIPSDHLRNVVPSIAFASEVETGSQQETASEQKTGARL